VIYIIKTYVINLSLAYYPMSLNIQEWLRMSGPRSTIKAKLA